MSEQYLYTCKCGYEFPIQITQAGWEIQCPKCMTMFEAPSMLAIRRLPRVGGVSLNDRAQKSAKRPVAANRVDWFSIGLAIAIIFGLLAGLVFYLSNKYYMPPPDFPAASKEVNDNIDRMPGTKLFEMFDQIESTSLPEHREPEYIINTRKFKSFRYASYVIGGIGILGIMLASFGFISSQKSKN